MRIQLILGGGFQGKLEFALNLTGCSQKDVADETLPQLWRQKPILNHLHRLVYQILQQGGNPQAVLEDILCQNPHAVILCNEIGCGIVPMNAFERKYREAVGRLCCELAHRAGRVIRVQCGLPMVLKGEPL